MCFQDVREHPDGSGDPETGGGGRPGETDKNSTERDRDRERPRRVGWGWEWRIQSRFDFSRQPALLASLADSLTADLTVWIL